jgi:ankyrin repeat protein
VARFGRLEAVRLLLEGGARPDVPDSDGSTPLAHAVWHGQLEAVRVLLEGGADPNLAASDGNTPLTHAVTMYGQLEVMRREKQIRGSGGSFE